VCSKYSGGKREKYEQAADSLLETAWNPYDSRVEAFVKAEKMNASVKLPAPRIIQGRSARHTLELATYLEPVDHLVYGLKALRSQNLSRRTRSIAKGLNQTQRASAIRAKWANFGKPVVLGIDASKFDKHVALEVLQQGEHKVYEGLYPGDRHLKTLLASQCNNRGRSACGLRYKVRGGRMSGDKNTAVGNCLLMLLFVRAAMRRTNVRKWDVFVDGDDTLIFLEESDVSTVRSALPDAFLAYGQEIKLESESRCLQEVLHCQCRMTKIDGVWMMLRPWTKILSSALCSHKHYEGRKSKRLMRSVAQAELALNQGVPIVQEFCLKLLEATGDTPCYSGDLNEISFAYRTLGPGWEHVKARPVSASSRAEFARTWGVGPDEQRRYEAEIASTDVSRLELPIRAWDWMVGEDVQWNHNQLDGDMYITSGGVGLPVV